MVYRPSYIGFTGAPGAGKDTAASVFVNNGDALNHSSSEAIKDVFVRNYCVGIPEEKAEWMCRTHEGKASTHPYLTWGSVSELLRLQGKDLSTVNPNEPIENRTFLRLLGHALIALDPVFLMRPMEKRHQETGKTIIDGGVRAEEQAQFLWDRGGVLIYVKRPEKEAETLAATDDPHELYWNNCSPDYTIENTGSVEDLLEASRMLAEKLSLPQTSQRSNSKDLQAV